MKVEKRDNLASGNLHTSQHYENHGTFAEASQSVRREIPSLRKEAARRVIHQILAGREVHEKDVKGLVEHSG